jgi:hypothetical protein
VKDQKVDAVKEAILRRHNAFRSKLTSHFGQPDQPFRSMAKKW